MILNIQFDDAIDSNIDVYEDECPSLDACDGITAYYYSLEDSDNCIGPFERCIPDNYTLNHPELFVNCFYAPRVLGNTFLFFSVYDMRWICSDTIYDVTNGGKCRDYNNSSSIINYQLDPLWNRFKQIKSINDYSWSFTDEQVILIECTSSSPTASPSSSPTTDEPSSSPTTEPTRVPTNEQIAITNDPTSDPSTIPSTVPTISPVDVETNEGYLSRPILLILTSIYCVMLV